MRITKTLICSIGFWVQPNKDDMEWVAIISMIAACVAALHAFRSSRTARQAYRLTLEQDLRHRPSLELYLVSAYILRLNESRDRLYVFHTRVTNKSYSGNSIKEMQLVIECDREQGPPSNFAIPHDFTLAEHLSSEEDLFDVPCELGAHTILERTALFLLQDDLLRNSRIASYALRIIDTYGNKTDLVTIFLQEHHHEPLEKNIDSTRP